MKIIGATMNGCFAEYALIPEVSAKRIPEEVSWEEGALLEPMGVALRPVSEGNVLGETVAVIGCGPIGQLAIMLAKSMGAAKVFACDVNPFRLDMAKNMGADVIINSKENDPVRLVLEQTGGLGVGAAIELSGSSEGINTAFGVLRKGAKIFIIGQPKGRVELDVGRDIVVKEAKVMGFHGREMYRTWELAERLLKTEKIDIGRIITCRYGMDRYEEAFQILKEGTALKVLLLPEVRQ
jgi:threonine 3-dehydrogenase